MCYPSTTHRFKNTVSTSKYYKQIHALALGWAIRICHAPMVATVRQAQATARGHGFLFIYFFYERRNTV